MPTRVTRRGLLKATGAVSGGVIASTQYSTETGAQSADAVTIDRTLGDEVFLPPIPDATVTGTSTFNPGSEFTVRIESTGATPLLLTSETAVTDAGIWSASFDLSGFDEGLEFVIVVSYQNEPLARAPGVVRTVTASLEFDDQIAQASGTIVSLEAVSLEVGGFVSVHEGTAEGPIIGVSRFLEPDQTYSQLEVSLDRGISGRTTLVATPHLDTDRDQTFDPSRDQPYTADGERVIDEAIVRDATSPSTTTEAVEPTQTSEGPTRTTAPPTLPDTPERDGAEPPMDIVVGGAGGVLGTAFLREVRKRWNDNNNDNHPPDAKIWYSPSEPEPGRPIVFDGRGSSDPDPGDLITNYHWSIDDDDEVTPRFVHSFAKADEYDVTLTVTDSQQTTDTKTETVTVESHEGELVLARVNPDSPGDDHSNPEQESLSFENAGDEPLDLEGWTISDAAEEAGRVRAGEHAFTFDPGFHLEPGTTVTVHTGPEPDEGEQFEDSETERHLFWGKSRAVWNNEADVIVVADDRENPVLATRYERTEDDSYELEDLDMEVFEDWFPTVVLSARDDAPPVDVSVDEGLLRSWASGLVAFFVGAFLLRGPGEFLWSWSFITAFLLSFSVTWAVSTGNGFVEPSIDPLALVGVTLPAAGMMAVGGVVWLVRKAVSRLRDWLT